MADNPNTIRQFSGLPMQALIGGPLKAAADANAMVSREQTAFLLSTCFVKESVNSAKLIPKMIRFKLERAVLNPDGTQSKTPATMEFSIPFMVLLPLSSLAIEKLEVSFAMEIKSTREQANETQDKRKKTSNQSVKKKQMNDAVVNTELHGTLSSKSSSNSSTVAQYEIKLEAGQLPLPLGVKTILDIFSQNIAPLPAEKPAISKPD